MALTIDIKEVILFVLIGALLVEAINLISSHFFRLIAIMLIAILFIVVYPESISRLIIFESSETAIKRYVVFLGVIFIIIIFWILSSFGMEKVVLKYVLGIVKQIMG
ncbi:hypothetical protein HYU22_02895 [Candidatus Woesearchaeota archaeon]|nr:hypothetical protein [Candidatus Woesearchaeota archaeon]